MQRFREQKREVLSLLPPPPALAGQDLEGEAPSGQRDRRQRWQQRGDSASMGRAKKVKGFSLRNRTGGLSRHSHCSLFRRSIEDPQVVCATPQVLSPQGFQAPEVSPVRSVAVPAVPSSPPPTDSPATGVGEGRVVFPDSPTCPPCHHLWVPPEADGCHLLPCLQLEAHLFPPVSFLEPGVPGAASERQSRPSPREKERFVRR